MNRSKLAILIFVGSEAFFFLALIVTYVYYSHPGGKISQTASYLDIVATAIFSIFLFSSSLTIALADIAMKKGKRKSVLSWLLATIGLGLVFLIGQGHEYAGLIARNVTISRDVFGSAFFTLTGFHGLHVLIGLITLTVMFSVIYSGKYKTVQETAFTSASIYWHFVDAVWVFVFSVVYIGAIV